MEFLAAALVMLVASYLLTSALTPGPTNAKPHGLQEFDFPQSAEGTPQAVAFGDVWSGDWAVLWYGDFEVEPIRSGGGKK
jgi:hypothetical protein